MTDTGTHLPTTKQIKDLLGGLLGRDVTVSPTAPLGPSPRSPRSVGVYVDDRFGVRAVIACDLDFSARAGAALALVPAPIAQESIEANALDDSLAENLYEVLSVAASLFNVAGATHVRLLEMHPASAPLPQHLAMRLLTLGRREDLDVDIAGYGLGRFSVVICG